MKKIRAFLPLACALVVVLLSLKAQGGGIGSTVTDPCKDASGKFDSTKDPNRCGQSRMLREGNNIYVIYRLHAKKRLKKVTDEIDEAKKNGKLSETLIRFQKDGTCLKSENDVEKLEKQCLPRLKRLTLDAELETRRELVRQNNGRRELLGDKGQLGAGQLIHAEGGADAGKDNILKDFKDAITLDKKNSNAPNTYSAAQKLLALPPQEPNYGNGSSSKAGDTLKKGEAAEATKIFDTRDINPDATKNDEASNFYEVGTGENNSALSAKIAAVSKADSELIKADQKAVDQDDKERRKPGATKPKESVSVSAEAFEEVLEDVALAPCNKLGTPEAVSDCKAKARAKAKGRVLDGMDTTKDILMPISNGDIAEGGKPAPGQEKKKSLDDTLSDELKEQAQGAKP